MELKSQFEKTKQILQGLELLYPEKAVILRTRYAVENILNLNKDEQEKGTFIADLFKIVENISDSNLFFSPQELKSILLENDPLISVWKIVKRVQETNSSLPSANALKKMYYQLIYESSDIDVLNFLADTTQISLIKKIATIRSSGNGELLHECFSQGQVKSKEWLKSEILKLNQFNYSRIELHCGWYALLSNLLNTENIPIYSYDSDDKATQIAKLLGPPNLRAETKDVYTIESYPQDSLIINTSCEHLKNFDQWYEKLPKGTKLALQSNNFFDCDQHSNCILGLDEFKLMAPMGTIHFAGELKLPQYTRFMIIGEK